MINEVHLATLRYLATQASVMMEVVFATGSSLLPVYQTSYSYVESVFLSFVEQAGRSASLISHFNVHNVFVYLREQVH